MKMTENYLCIHGHFYQPPRENPWLEAIEYEASAKPFHNWNDRITRECYGPNARARVHGQEGRILRLLNNYEYMSFNFGPTLLSWFPDARVVALVRDPRGFLCSYKNYHRRGVPSYRERYNPFTNSVLWRSYMSALLEFRSGPCGESLHALHYERLVTDPETEVRALCAHVGVGFEQGMLDVARANSSFVPDPETGSQRGIVTTSRERWRTELTSTEIWLGERIFGKAMVALGYESASTDERLRPSLPELNMPACPG